MTLTLIKHGEKKFTRFMIPIKQLKFYEPLLKKYVDIEKPSKKNSKFIYFEYEGDLLNGKDAIK